MGESVILRKLEIRIHNPGARWDMKICCHFALSALSDIYRLLYAAMCR